MANDLSRSPRPSWWWVPIGLIGAVVLAWIAGSTGGGITAVPSPPMEPPTDTAGTDTDPDDLLLIEDAEAFWSAVGTGDVAAVQDMLDPLAGAPLVHYAGFAAGFEAGFSTEDCRTVATGVVRCLLGADNAPLIDLYRGGTGATVYVASASVTFSGDGIEAFELPDLINTTSTRLLAHAVETASIPAECDRINYDALDLPPFNTSMAQTADCARQLLAFLPGALAGQVP